VGLCDAERVGVEKLVTRHISLMERLRKAQVRQDNVRPLTLCHDRLRDLTSFRGAITDHRRGRLDTNLPSRCPNDDRYEKPIAITTT
jgi:hypothetical protein